MTIYQNTFLFLKIVMDEADLAVFGFGCSYERMRVVNCPPSITYLPNYYMTRYPKERTKIWNLFRLLTPISWLFTFSAIALIVITLKWFTFVGTNLAIKTINQDITLVPLR